MLWRERTSLSEPKETPASLATAVHVREAGLALPCLWEQKSRDTGRWGKWQQAWGGRGCHKAERGVGVSLGSETRLAPRTHRGGGRLRTQTPASPPPPQLSSPAAEGAQGTSPAPRRHQGASTHPHGGSGAAPRSSGAKETAGERSPPEAEGPLRSPPREGPQPEPPRLRAPYRRGAGRGGDVDLDDHGGERGARCLSSSGGG